LGTNAFYTFTFNNTKIAANDMVLIQHISGGTLGGYNITATPAGNSALITIRNSTSASLPENESPLLRFMVIKSANS
jgi:hypothetical protein